MSRPERAVGSLQAPSKPRTTTYVRGFEALPFGELRNIHVTHSRAAFCGTG